MIELKKAQAAWEKAEAAAALARMRRERAARAAHKAQVKPSAIAGVLKVSPGRVTQIIAAGNNERPAGGPRGAATEKR